jgi:hypothetical protein
MLTGICTSADLRLWLFLNFYKLLPLLLRIYRYLLSESIEWLIEGQAFSQSYDMAPHSPYLPPIQSVGLKVHKRENFFGSDFEFYTFL